MKSIKGRSGPVAVGAGMSWAGPVAVGAGKSWAVPVAVGEGRPQWAPCFTGEFLTPHSGGPLAKTGSLSGHPSKQQPRSTLLGSVILR
ncbi:hypothetical protein J6590_030001 [Homalodisca vitripennis]|nr:hypothetical protein J6590_030001 [Homalodisca vitripennis]